MSLCTFLDRLDFAKELDILYTILTSTDVSISFWGERLVTSTRFTGSIPLDEIAKRVCQAAIQRFDANDLTLADRRTGLDITEKLIYQYRDTDALLLDSPWFTRLFSWIREFLLHFTSMRSFTEKNLQKHFLAYTEENYREEIGPLEGENKSLATSYINSRPYIIVSETSL